MSVVLALAEIQVVDGDNCRLFAAEPRTLSTGFAMGSDGRPRRYPLNRMPRIWWSGALSRLPRVSLPGRVNLRSVAIGGGVGLLAAVIGALLSLLFVSLTDPDEGANIGAGNVFLAMFIVGIIAGGYITGRREPTHPVLNAGLATGVAYWPSAVLFSLGDDFAITIAFAAFNFPVVVTLAALAALWGRTRQRRVRERS